MRRMNLNVKLIGGFVVMGLILSIGGFLGPLGISKLGEQLEGMSTVDLPAMDSLGTIAVSQKTIFQVTQSLLIPEIFSNASEKNRLFKRLEDNWQQANAAVARYEGVPKTKEVQVHWENFKNAWESWQKTHKSLIPLTREGNREPVLAFISGPEKEAYADAEKYLQDLLALRAKLGTDAGKTEHATAARLKNMVLTGTGMGIAMAMIFGFLFSRLLTRPIKHTIDNLSETYERFMATADQLAAVSHQLSGSTANQAAAVQEASAVIEELDAIVQSNSEDVQNLLQMVEKTGTIGYQAFETFRKSKKATKEIKLAIEETSKIVKTIGEIAFQSNLLALSASVEAARTNEAGIGFSVVAQEVRNLSIRSTEASKNTSDLIEVTARQIARGDELVRSSLSGFISYGQGSTPITEFTSMASDVSQKQAEGVGQINNALKEISQTAQKNAGIAEESAAVAQEISAQAQKMAEVIGELKQAV